MCFAGCVQSSQGGGSKSVLADSTIARGGSTKRQGNSSTLELSAGSTSNVALANSLMELSHNPRALLSVYTYKKGVCESKPVQLAVNKGKLAGALLYFSGLS